MKIMSFTVERPQTGSRPVELPPGDDIVAIHPDVWFTPPPDGQGGPGTRHEGYRIWVRRP